jgi:Stigma-specific protein, Stig1
MVRFFSLLLISLSLILFVSCSPTGTSNNNNNNTNNTNNCQGDLTECNGACVNLATDDTNCGSCNNSCGFDEHCDGSGNCLLQCPSGTIDCGGICSNLMDDQLNCGSCDIKCDPGYICLSGNCDYNSCEEASSEAEAGVLPADIIVVVDNSGSMADEAASVQASMNAFVSTIVASNIDAHVILISANNTEDCGICVPSPVGSGNCPSDENLPAYRHIENSVGSTNALSTIINTFPQWQPSLRATATKTILVISDDNSSMGAIDFTNQIIALDPAFQGFKFSGIIAPYEISEVDCALCEFQGTCNTPQCDTCCGTDTLLGVLCTPLPASEGTVYRDLILNSGGIEGNLCLQDFQPAFTDLATAVIYESEVDCVYNIPDPGEEISIDYDRVNVDYQESASAEPETIIHVPGGLDACGSSGGWYYDDNTPPLQVLLCPTTCSAVTENFDAVIAVKFGCTTILQ